MQHAITYALALACVASSQGLNSIPTISFNPAEGGNIEVSGLSSIIVDAKFAEVVDDNGLTLIPPTLNEFATTFSDDLAKTLGWNLPVESGVGSEKHVIFLTLGDPSNYLDVAGRRTSEGYSLNVTKTRVTITGASPLGVWWGTRTLLQHLAATGEGTIPLGHATDSPGWGNRGLMVSFPSANV